MKLLLTSAGIKNESIKKALIELLGKPISESNALCIPTASYSNPGGPQGAWRFITGKATTPMCEFEWKSLGVLELSALPSINKEQWINWINQTDVLLVNGGDALFLSHWMRESGLAELLPTFKHLTYVGLSAGSMVMAPRIGEEFVGWRAPDGTDSTLGIVDFAIFPHVDHEKMPDNAMIYADEWAAKLSCPAYAIDDDTAIQVVDGEVSMVTEGHWKFFQR